MCVIETITDQIFTDSSGKKTVRQRYRTKRGKERYRYIALVSCSYCGEDFVPTRRGVHKYCSNSCRSRACKERNHYDAQSQALALPNEPIGNVDLIQVSEPPKEQFSLIRTGENALAAGTVATVQYFVLENMISKQFESLRQEIRQSEQRITRNVQAIIDAKLKRFAPPPSAAGGIDAQAFRMAQEML